MGVKAEHRVTVVYCRVSCKGQKPDLDRQLESMQMWAVGSGTVVDEWITEIGGGMNFKRPKEALQKPSLILRPENFCLLHNPNFCANDCSGYF